MQIAEAAVALAFRMNGAIFFPKQGQRHAGALELPLDRGPVRLCLDKAGDLRSGLGDGLSPRTVTPNWRDA